MLLLLAAACSAGNPPGAPRDLHVARTASSVRGRGPEQPQVVLAPSATALSRAIEANVPDSGDGTYLAAYWGEKPTGGYSLGVESAHVEGARVMVRLALKEPPQDAFVTQALTHPCALAVVRDLDPRGKRFSFVDQTGRELGWPIRLAGG